MLQGRFFNLKRPKVSSLAFEFRSEKSEGLSKLPKISVRVEHLEVVLFEANKWQEAHESQRHELHDSKERKVRINVRIQSLAFLDRHLAERSPDHFPLHIVLHYQVIGLGDEQIVIGLQVDVEVHVGTFAEHFFEQGNLE